MSNLVSSWSAGLLAFLERKSGDRFYAVCGKIVFHGRWDLDDTSALREAILAQDAEHPWQDLQAHEAMMPKSIEYLSLEPTEQRAFPDEPLRYWFEIHPRPGNLRRQQVYAYQRYLEALADGLAKRQIPGVKAVHVVLETITASDTFPCE